MVQRKVPSKLGILAGGFHTEKLSTTMRPYITNNDDRPKGADLKLKKMKKSRSFKRSDADILSPRPSSSSGKRNEASQPARKPLPHGCFTVAPSTPQKQTLNKVPAGSPNYMKSTSSSDARKEQKQVITRVTTPTISPGCKTPTKKLSISASNIHTALNRMLGRTVGKTCSLKKVRTLTQSPSFKHVRAPSANRCSKVSLCANLDAQRATCSSTLKDSKFPPYLTLSPGATENEGTSIMKVCPYNYCSLNGHHHIPALPLRCFLFSRRRLLKAQKNVKQVVLSPRKAKKSDVRFKETEPDLLVSDAKSTMAEAELPPDKASQESEKYAECFIQIYIKKQDDTNEADHGSMIKPNEEPPGVIMSPIYSTEDEKGYEHRELTDSPPNEACCDMVFIQDSPQELISENSKAILEPQHWTNNIEDQHHNSSDCKHELDLITMSLYAESCSDINFEDDVDFDTLSSDLDFSYPDDALAEDYLSKLAQDRKLGENFCDGYDMGGSSSSSPSRNDFFSEASDMEWEERQLSASHADNEDYSSTDKEINPDQKLGSWIRKKNQDLQDESSLSPDDILRYFLVGLLSAEQQASYEEFSDGPGLFSDADSDDILHNFDAKNFTDQGEAKFITLTSVNSERPITEDADEEMTPIFEDTVIDTDMNSIEASVTIPGNIIEDKERISDAKESFKAECKCEAVNEMDKDINISAPLEQIKDKIFTDKIQFDLSYGELPENPQFVVDENLSEEDHHGKEKFATLSSRVSEENADSNKRGLSSYNNPSEAAASTEMGGIAKPDTTATFPTANSKTSLRTEYMFSHNDNDLHKMNPNTSSSPYRRQGCKGQVKEEESKQFNLKEPNYLPVEAGPEPESVDLRPQDMDERKNAEEWMLDYALQKTVTELGPARKRKVALLVEAFETVTPRSKGEPLRNAAASAKRLQGCT